MMVNRTFSKAFGLAGLRIGYMLCDPALASYFNRVRFPWNVSQLAIAAALAALEDEPTRSANARMSSLGANTSLLRSTRSPACKALPVGRQFRSDRRQRSGRGTRSTSATGWPRRASSSARCPGTICRAVSSASRSGRRSRTSLFIETFKEYIQRTIREK